MGNTTWHRLHVFRCYRHDARKFVEVLADSHKAAAKIAAEQKGWQESEVITRYVITTSVNSEVVKMVNEPQMMRLVKC